MACPTGRHRIVFNGEIYNHPELRRELADYPYRSRTDTEVVLAAYLRWGEDCLDRLVGMFAFAIWDERDRRLFAARDRFGVKPFHYAETADGTFLFASELKAVHRGGIPEALDEATWASYLVHGRYERGEHTFFEGVRSLPAGHVLVRRLGTTAVRRWYDLPARVGAADDPRPAAEVQAEYLALLEESVRLRFRSDVPVGIALSGGLDSSLLLALVHRVQGPESAVRTFTFVTGDPAYDETPFVERMLARTQHPRTLCALGPDDVPRLAEDVARHQDEPFGGVPTLAYARLFEHARAEGVTVLLDGQGMDEQWAGYDYYRAADGGRRIVQGTNDRPTRPECLEPAFRALAEELPRVRPFGDSLRDLQHRDLLQTKIPRALRFNDRASMRVGCELREPFLDHRLVELALRQPRERKIRDDQGKRLLRDCAARLVPGENRCAPKRPVQTPQREWLRGLLQGWVADGLDELVAGPAGDWFDRRALANAWNAYRAGEGDNSFYVWQWISVALAARHVPDLVSEAR